MIPVIAIVGRSNTGKSTLFNRLTHTRNALVANRPGVTRDRIYGFAEHGGRRYLAIDTGGLDDTEADDQAMAHLVSRQSRLAIQEADAVFWLVDGRSGITAADEILAGELRRQRARLYLLVNKTEGLNPDIAAADFHALGVGTPWPVSGLKGHGLKAVLDAALAEFPAVEEMPADPEQGLRIAVIGRPNVGKSTLINRILGEERLLTYDKPGTTRDSIIVPFERQGKRYQLVDTAGVRRRAQLTDPLEKYSVIKSLQAVESAQIVIAVIDASEALTDQDLHLLGLTQESGKPLIIAVNKWDNLEKDQRDTIRRQLDRKLAFVDYAVVHFISALHGSGVGKLFVTINQIARVITLKINPAALTAILEEAVEMHSPPLVHGRRIKLRYAHLGGHNPLRVIIHGNQTEHVPASYVRFLANHYRKKLRLTGTPVMIEFKYSENPYKGKRNVLTDRQVKKRQRLIRHVKRRG
jgi:GTP-binding protein